MIRFKDNRPILRFGECLFTDYGDHWLEKALEHAAERAGTTLPFKHDLLAAIRYYLEHKCDLSVMTINELYDRVRSMLVEVGLKHLAHALHNELPALPVNLDDIAKTEPLWLFFVTQLNKQVTTLKNQGVTRYLFTERKACVMTLQGKHKWDKSCGTLLQELEAVLTDYSS